MKTLATKSPDRSGYEDPTHLRWISTDIGRECHDLQATDELGFWDLEDFSDLLPVSEASD